jgi:hypothetical protein
MKLLESVKLCKKASVVLGDMMEEVSANFTTSRQSQLVLMNLKKVLEAIVTIENTVDTAITRVLPDLADIQYTHASLRAKGKRNATQQALRIEPLKKACTSKTIRNLLISD